MSVLFSFSWGLAAPASKIVMSINETKGNSKKIIQVSEEKQKGKKKYRAQLIQAGKVKKSKTIDAARASSAETLTLTQIWDNNYKGKQPRKNCPPIYEVSIPEQQEVSKVCSTDYLKVASTQRYVKALNKILF